MCYRNALHIKMKKTLLSRSFLLFYFRLCERCSRYICPKVGNISWGKGRGKQEDLGEGGRERGWKGGGEGEGGRATKHPTRIYSNWIKEDWNIDRDIYVCVCIIHI